jgi:polyferredoxin
MDKMGYETGLIRYTTENALAGKKVRILRPRVVIYAVILLVVLGGIFWSLSTKTPLRAEIIRDRNQLFRTLSDGRIENIYTIKLINQDQQAHEYLITIPGSPDIEIDVRPAPRLEAGQVGAFSLSLITSASLGEGSVEVLLDLRAADDPAIRIIRDTRILLPVNSGL